jgi:hypothetical protein
VHLETGDTSAAHGWACNCRVRFPEQPHVEPSRGIRELREVHFGVELELTAVLHEHVASVELWVDSKPSRQQNRSLRGRRAVPVWEYANECVGVWVVCTKC